ncbi:FecCD family ABC transporter permease [Effusibacillus dendaii]|uniref:Corrinoid ABC transporter permease n=1 Tax=Effusibacillus dendaii TaxID=2743772 RepID=A0A7I8D894_9BACL|nr:iron ABC transporter permease [Effusibacillus dendaii]BCJ85239.1 corrinoid ABC transporter permease [Effusibacillus dendaii]
MLLAVLCLTVGFAVSVGSTTIPFSHSVSYLLSRMPVVGSLLPVNWTETEASILWQIRLPRVTLGLLVGALLALAGTALQGLLRNPLADPYILGVSAGASVGAASVIAVVGGGLAAAGFLLPLAAFVGALLAVFAMFGVASAARSLRTETLLLSGVVVNSFFSAALTFLLSLSSGNQTQQIVFWMLGSLGLRSWHHNLILLPFFAVGFLVIWAFARELNTFGMGEEGAATLGVPLTPTKWVLLLTVSLVTAAAVSVAGIIGFVGLVIPHMMRRMIGSDHRLLIPFAALAGGIFLVLCDTVARTLLAPVELSIGAVTAAIGAPFFAWQLQRSRRGER